MGHLRVFGQVNGCFNIFLRSALTLTAEGIEFSFLTFNVFDLSLIVKAREDGANHLFSILTGYEEAPEDVHLMPGLSYNPYFEGGQIAMPPPLTAEQVEFMDGTPATLEQMARDEQLGIDDALEDARRLELEDFMDSALRPRVNRKSTPSQLTWVNR